MPHYATIQVRHVPGNTMGPDQIVEELMLGQDHATWGRRSKLIRPADAPQLYDRAIAGARKRVEDAKGTFTMLDGREVLVRVVEKKKYKRRKPRVWEGFLRVVEVDVTPRLVERVTESMAKQAGIQVKGGLIT